MAAGTSASFCFLIVCFLVCSSEAQEIIRHEIIRAEKADLGQDVILPCEAPNKKIRAVEWIRPDQDPEYVLSYRDGHLDPEQQHPSYQNRVDLQDKEMKDGDVSLVLKNVTKEDGGTYECRVFEKGKNELISITNLEVLLPGDKGGNTGDGRNKTGTIAGSVVGVILLLAVASVSFWLYRRHMKKNPNLPVPPDDPAV